MYKNLIKNKKEFIRFCIVGSLSTLAHYILYFILQLVVNAYIAYTVAYGCTFIANFYFSSHYTFTAKPSVKKFGGMAVAHGINYLICMLLLKSFLYLGVRNELAPFPVYLISVPVNFIMVRTVFKSSKLKEKIAMLRKRK